jgi:N12 class adenine-specific DNA methylase
VGVGAGEIHPAAAGGEGVARNAANYRITDADRLGEGPLRRKFEQNVAALELLFKIEQERRPATDVEKAVLVKYTGWGGMPQVFATPAEAPGWKAEQKKLKELLEPASLDSARATVLNAHYTSPTVIRAMFAAVSRLGFTHGRVLEPACGLGHFFGLMPAEMAARSQLTGIEIDRVTARLTAMLYPDAEIHAQPFEEATLPTNSFDLAISNVPFGDYAPFDPKLNRRKFKIHDYFFVAAAERVRAGGLIAFITSRGTLDKQYPHLREAVAQQCDLLAAIRLPNTAFKKNANTEVTTDIVILRKRAPGEKAVGPAWQESRPMAGGTAEKPIFLNEYYHERPAMMLGKLEQEEHGMYGRDEVTLASDGRDLGEALASAVSVLPESIYQPLTATQAAAQRQVIPVPPGVKPNAYVLTDHSGGGIAVREGDELRLLTELSPMTARRIRRLIQVRDAARECLRSQVEDRPEAELAAARFRLNQDYDYFVGQFGPVAHSANVRAFAGDPDLPLLLSLENYDEASNTAAKTAIFRERTIQRRAAVTTAGGPKEALVVTLSERGRVDLEHIGRLLGKSEAEFLPELQGAVFHNPVSKRWETDDEYLSGNVREKLAVAERMAQEDARYRLNAEALRGVQPADLKATEIDARLGAAWIPAEDVAAFGQKILRMSGPQDVRVSHVPQFGLWTVEVSHYAKTGVANRSEWGTVRMAAYELLEAALNLRTPTVYDYDENKNPKVNAVATEAAREKQQKIKDRFAEWIWEDDARRERLVAFYNREYNHTRLRIFSGEHLTLPGASPTITLRPHQKAGVWRILQTPNALLAHVVGAGKTFTMAAAAMELKRLGLARKPMFVVPNHMLGQFSTELLTLYPGANVLVAGKDDFASARRRELMSRIATNNWDAVIVTHSGFERLPMSERAQKEFLTGQLVELEECIREQKGKTSGSSDTRMVKQLERAKKKLTGKIKTMAAVHRKDDTLTFEEIGVDRLFVDEAQAFKNLFYVTKMTRVAGLPQTASERAFDMFLKVQHVQRMNDGGGVVFATGTPVTNTMAEMFTMQRYLQMNVIRRQHLQHFDAWAGTFGETVSAMELAPDGAGYRLNTRFARFVNVPELMHLFRQAADVQTADMLKLPVPELEGGKPQVIRAPATPELKAFVNSLAKRAEKLKTGLVDPSVDNMLKITGEGRKAALDLRLMRPAVPDHSESKVNLAVREIFKIWQATGEQRLTQMVFCDLSTPQAQGRSLSVYQDLKAKVVALGVPTEEIQFMQDHDSDAAKLTLFKDVRSGRVRILMGSTQKMGAGTNVQAKLVALHHLDAPWRPADIEQREGRIRRQGNSNATIKIFRYVTEGSFDAYMWQTLETKAKFISQVMTGETTARRIEDLDAPALTYAEVKAIASGNPMIVEKAKVDAEVMKLSRLRAEHAESQFSHRGRLRMMEQDVVRLERQMGATEKDLAARQDTQGEKFKIVLNGEVFTDRVKAGTALIYLAEDHRTDHLLGRPSPAVLGEFAGFKLEYRSTLPDKVTLRGASEYAASVSPSPVGTISSLEHAARSVQDQIERTRQELAQTTKNLGELSNLAGNVWEHEEHYRTLVKRQAELVDALDITKNQAASQLATESEETETVSNSAPGEETSEEVGAEAAGPAETPEYFEDQSPELQAEQRSRRRAEIEAIGRLEFPVAAIFDGTPVTILGPVDRFSPYKEQATGKEDPFQLMVQPPKGKRFITLASGLQVNGKPLVTRVLPMREKANPFAAAGLGGKSEKSQSKIKSAPASVQPSGKSTPPELMTPGEFKAAGLGPANDAIVLKAARHRKPVSALAVDEYNLKHSLPRGYVREGDRFVFKIQSVPHSERAILAPALMTPAEARRIVTVSLSGKDAWARFPGRERWLSPGSKSKELAIERAHRGEITRATQAGQPVSAVAVETFKIKLPDGYEKEGDRFVSTGVGENRASAVAPTVATTRVSRRNSAQRRMAA